MEGKHNMKKILYAILLLSALVVLADETWGKFRIRNDGTVQFENLNFQTTVMFRPKWLSTAIVNPVLKKTEKQIRFHGSLEVPGQDMTGVYEYSCTSEPSGGFRFSGSLTFPAPLPINTAHLGFSVPLGTLVEYDGKCIALPEVYKKTVVAQKNCRELKLYIPGGMVLEIRDAFRFVIQDNRAFRKNSNNFSFRILYKTLRKQQELKLNCSINAYPVKSRIVDITKAANRGFRDDFAEDGKGGWTDQGAGHDLRMVPAGIMKYEQIPFRIVDEKKHPGRTVIAVAGEDRSIPVAEAVLELPENDAKGLSLLHTSAWTPPEFGEMTVQYADGSQQKIPVTGTKECGNWCNPQNRSNGYVLWRGFTTQNVVGLYVSSFKLTGKKPRRIVFRITDPKAVWLIAGVTLNGEYVPVRFQQEQEVIVREGKEWAPLKFKSEIPEGSALDFSFLLDAPAGKYGRIIAAPDGRLVYENLPEKTVRLWGENICQYALRHDKPVFRSLAEYFARMGVNLIRLHHHDNDLVAPGSETGTDLNYEHLDRLEYFVAEMKKNGIYVTTDLFTSRKVNYARIPELRELLKTRKNPGKNLYKVLLPFSDAALEDWKAFVRNWMTHRNPYTGMTWAEDPVLVYLNLVNEDNVSISWNYCGLGPFLQEKFDLWTKANALPASKISNSNRDFRRFLDEAHSACYRKMMDFLRNECGVKAMLTSHNFYSDVPVTILRNQFDLVDDHLYGDHPSAWGLPQGYSQGNSLISMGGIARQFSSSRIFGKPFSVTEFSFPAPNIYRAAWGPLMGAYAAFQDWNALTRFAYGFSTVNSTPRRIINDFESANEPMTQFSDRIFAALFLRGDVTPAPEKVALKLPDFYRTKHAEYGFPGDFQMLGLITRTGSVIRDEQIPDGADLFPHISNEEIRRRWRTALEKRVAVSSTDELMLDGNKGVFRVDTPRTQCITLPGGSASTGALSVGKVNTFTTVAVISLDGKPLKETRSAVLFHLTDVCNSNIRFANEQKTVVLNKGTLPLLFRRGSAEVSLAADRPFTVTALDCDGVIKGTIPGTVEDGHFRFTLKNDRFPGGVMVYHLTR